MTNTHINHSLNSKPSRASYGVSIVGVWWKTAVHLTVDGDFISHPYHTKTKHGIVITEWRGPGNRKRHCIDGNVSSYTRPAWHRMWTNFVLEVAHAVTFIYAVNVCNYMIIFPQILHHCITVKNIFQCRGKIFAMQLQIHFDLHPTPHIPRTVSWL